MGSPGSLHANSELPFRSPSGTILYWNFGGFELDDTQRRRHLDFSTDEPDALTLRLGQLEIWPQFNLPYLKLSDPDADRFNVLVLAFIGLTKQRVLL